MTARFLAIPLLELKNSWKRPLHWIMLLVFGLMSFGFVAGGVLTALLAGMALLSLVWTPYPVAEIDIPSKLQPPSAAHWLGTDSLGRDIASQILVGAQNSIVVGVIAVGIGLGFGVLRGCIAAARRGWVEELIMRGSDFAFAFPALLLAIMLTASGEWWLDAVKPNTFDTWE